MGHGYRGRTIKTCDSLALMEGSEALAVQRWKGRSEGRHGGGWLMITAGRVRAGGEVQGQEAYDHPTLVLPRWKTAYFIGEKAAGIRILFC